MIKESPFGKYEISFEDIKYLILTVVFCALVIYVYGNISYKNPDYIKWDLHDYRAMAQAAPQLTNQVRQPFVFRILGPYLAGLLPFSINNSFLIISISSGISLSILFYLYLRSNIAEPFIAALVTILFLLNKYLFGFSNWNYFQICDTISEIEIVLLMWTMISKKWFQFGIILFLGSLTKETTLIMIPVVFIYLIETHIIDKNWEPVFSAILPALLASVTLHIVLRSDTGNNLVQALVAYSSKLMIPETWFRLLINSFLPFSLLPIIFSDTTRNYFSKRKYAVVYFMLVIISTFFGYNNERLMAPAFIVFYPIIAVIIKEHIARSRPMILMVIIAAIITSFHHTYARFPLPRELTINISLFAFVIISFMMLYYRIWLGKNYVKHNSENI